MLQAVVLGIVQGLTEFLPISSSGHLLLFRELFGWEFGPYELAYDVALNTGTFFAVLIYFFPTWWGLLTRGLLKRQGRELKLLGILVAATIPAALFGYFAQDAIETIFRQPAVAGMTLVIFGLLLWVAERFAHLKKDIADISLKDALTIGVAQALALVPGVSRSGITMTAGLSLGLKKEEAAQFSFLLLAPISFGAALLEADSVLAAPNTTEMAVGALVSFLVGIAAIHLLLSFVKKYGFAPYVWYRLIIGSLFLGLLLVR